MVDLARPHCFAMFDWFANDLLMVSYGSAWRPEESYHLSHESIASVAYNIAASNVHCAVTALVRCRAWLGAVAATYPASISRLCHHCARALSLQCIRTWLGAVAVACCLFRCSSSICHCFPLTFLAFRCFSLLSVAFPCFPVAVRFLFLAFRLLSGCVFLFVFRLLFLAFCSLFSGCFSLFSGCCSLLPCEPRTIFARSL